MSKKISLTYLEGLSKDQHSVNHRWYKDKGSEQQKKLLFQVGLFEPHHTVCREGVIFSSSPEKEGN